MYISACLHNLVSHVSTGRSHTDYNKNIYGKSSFLCKESIGTALNPQDKASKAMLSSLGQFGLAVRQLLPQQKKAVPTSRRLGSCELAFQHLKHKLEKVNGSVLRIIRKAWG